MKSISCGHLEDGIAPHVRETLEHTLLYFTIAGMAGWLDPTSFNYSQAAGSDLTSPYIPINQ